MQEDRHGERAHQARLANIRQELLTPANAILAYSQMTQEALDGREPEGAREDLDRIRDAADRLADMVDRLLEDQSPEDGDGEAEERIRSHLRHDLRTPINAIKGYGEMLVEDVEEAGAGNEALETDLRNLLTEANRMLTRIDTAVDRLHGEGEAAGAGDEEAEAGEAGMEASLAHSLAAVEDGRTGETATGKILVVDDNASNRDLLLRRLTREGHEVETAEGGRETLERVAAEGFDLILLDLLMPDMNGLEVLARLKGDEATREIPVIMISALDELDSIVRCIEVGAEDYLPKPFNEVLLRARIGSSLEKKEWRDRERAYVEELKTTQQRLVESEKMASLGGLVAGVSHEINTPVGNAVTAASHLQEQFEELKGKYQAGQMKRADFDAHIEQTGHGLGIILSNLHRTHELVQSFKSVAVDQSSEARERFGVRAYLEKVVTSLEPTLKKTPHSVSMDCPEELTLNSYPGALSQVVTNLVMNSVTHAYEEGEAGSLHLRAVQEDGQVRLDYTDDGGGIPPEVQQRIFEPFFTTKRGEGGSGLGMHVVYNLVTQKLGGQIECHSDTGQGTRFVVRLPLEEQ